MFDAISNTLQKQFCTSLNMDNAKPSSQAVAVWRAAHQILEQPVIFHDPIALAILGDAKSEVIDKLDLHKDPLSSAMRFAIAVRSRFAQDEREAVLENGVNQYVILGAGLDTYAYRSKHQHEKVFEVDLPATQAMKLARLKQQGIAPTCAVTYVACDFELDRLEKSTMEKSTMEKSALEKSLLAAGFDKNKKTFFSCLGVVAYLDLAAIEQTFHFITRCAPGSILVFDYIVDPKNLNEIEQYVLSMMSAQLASGGEPLKSFFDPQSLAQQLSSLGFSHIEDISPDYLNNRFLAQRNDGLRVGNVTRMFIAVV
ncbi:class I SAM-dependent methyltransferase [Cellvibrio mixtus]|uniref:class I SAM-dependent methyltransferase n=1 Tax=Cellvibrio mixtus TaxID=39650 RepID=UPI00069381BD|nr:SAM-dependent methyltransferase [Cellvibrio mixtus]